MPVLIRISPEEIAPELDMEDKITVSPANDKLPPLPPLDEVPDDT
jgi:hypothetical protein